MVSFELCLQIGVEILPLLKREVFRASFALEYAPKAWRSAEVVFIPKAGRSDYTITGAKSFRTIKV